MKVIDTKINKFAMVTRCDSKARELANLTHDILQDYAKQWDCDFIVLGDEIEDTGDYEKNHYRILEVQKLFNKYERLVIIDSDVIIMPGTPNPFNIVDERFIGSIFEDVGSRKVHRQMVIKDIQEEFGGVGWTDGYINTGFFICSKQHRSIFNDIDGKLWYGFGYDDALIGYNIRRYGFIVNELDPKWNFTAMFSEPWNDNASRFDAYIIHYAGQARFPDDLSGRKSMTNSIEDRIVLIENDIDRITQGLLTFKEAKPTPKQGYGSRVFEAKFGVQERGIILKVPNTEQCLHQELLNYTLGIPHTVDYLGMGDDPSVGKFLMFDKLNELPEKLDEALMLEIATKVLRVIRFCYNNGVTWIPKLDHIMIDDNGDVKVVDFGDDDYPAPMFYDKRGGEAIVMDGECDRSGNYIYRYDNPLSGYLAIMEYLCNKNDLPMSLIKMAERHIITTEYQSLKDVHQPINMKGFRDTLRTESEQGDAMYSKLVPANRKCIDRAKILNSNLPASAPKLPHGKTWLDIGCNVGWFCIEYADRFAMTGVDFDNDKIKFAKMISERVDADVLFKSEVIDCEYVDEMREYDIISAFSMLHLKLIEDKDCAAFWTLLEAICSKVRECFFFEFPPHSYSLADVTSVDEFLEKVQLIGKFSNVKIIGMTDAGRPMLKCVK